MVEDIMISQHLIKYVCIGRMCYLLHPDFIFQACGFRRDAVMLDSWSDGSVGSSDLAPG